MSNRQPSHSHALPLAANSIALFIGLQNCLSSISSDKPLKQCKNDILSFIQRMGPEGQKLAITSLMEHLQQPQAQDKLATSYRWSLLGELLKEYSPQDSFFSYFPEILYKNCSNKDKLGQYMTNIYNNLKLPLNIQISIALSLYLSDRGELITIGETDLISKVKQYASSEKQVKLPQKVLDELLFQINMNPELSNKLDNQTKYLLETAEKVYKSSQTRIYNYFRNQWQYFSNQAPVIQKPQPISLRKSDVLRDLGPSMTHQIDTLKAVISQIGILGEQDIFDCLMMMAEQKTKQDSNLDRFVIDLMCLNSSTKKNVKGEQLKKIFNLEPNNKKMQVSWNVDNFLQYIIQNIQNIKWQNVLSSLDKQNLQFSSDEHFVEIMKYFEKIKKLIKKWSLNDSIFLKKWVHAQSQAEFLMRLYSCKDPQCLFFIQAQAKKGQSSSTKQNSTNNLRQIWSFLELVTLLFEVSDYKRQRLKQILEGATSKYSDTLIKTLSEIKPNKGKPLVHQTFIKIFPQYLQNDAKSLKLLETIWNNNKQLFIKSISDLQKNTKSKKINELDLEKLVQVFQEIEGCLNLFALQANYCLSIPISLIAGKKEYINLQKWLIQKIDQDQQKFSKQMINYLQNNLFKQLRQSNESDQIQATLEQSQLTIQTLNKIFIVFLEKLKQDYSQSKYNQIFKKLQKQCCKLLPQIAQGQIYEQAQRECEQQIKKIYKQQISIKDAVQNLKRLKNSNKKQEMQHFANRITFLCIELTYHHSYPEKQLMITADLFSALINAHLMEKKIYQTFLHVIDQYLKQDNQQFTFAMKVMMNIKEKLAHQSWFCEKLIDNQLVMRKDPELVESIIKSIQPPKVLSIEKQRKLKQAIKQKNTPSQQSRRMILEPQVPSIPHEHKPSPPIEYDILGTLDRSKKMDIADRESKLRVINTICNTLSLTNIEEKTRELKKILDNQKVYKLLSYRILKIISITQNSGIEVFIKLLDYLPKVQKYVSNITYNILRSWFGLVGKSVNNDKKFAHFKNIGSWLGRITIGKGYPIPVHKLNIRQIITSSYLQSNRLSYTIPVVLRIMEPITTHPQIFRIQSPWLSRIIATLNEIEVNINAKQQQPLKNQIKAFFKVTKLQAVLENISGLNLLGHFEQQQICVEEQVEKIVITEELIALCQGFGISKIQIRGFLDSSVVEILDPVVERAVKISKTTTKQMISKDFALEISSQKVKESSVNLVRQLAAPLAQVTCRQPLKTAISKKIREAIKQKQEGVKIKQQEIQNLTQKVLAEILDAGCLIIKQKVAKAAQKSIRQDIELIETLQMRNYLKKSGTPLTNQSYLSTIPSIVPQELRPSHTGLSQQQYQIYRQLKRVRPKPQPNQTLSSNNFTVLIDSLSNHEPLQQLIKKISSQQITQEFLIKLHKLLLDQNNDENDFQYYLEICKEIKQYGGQSAYWKLFKNVADLKNNEKHLKIFRKLVREKYFDETVLDQIHQEETMLQGFYEKWIGLQQDQANQFVPKLQSQINKIGIKKQTFYHYCLKYILKKVSQQHTQLTQSFNPNYSDQLILLALSLANLSPNPISSLQPFIQQTICSACKMCEKSSQSQRLFFKMLTSLTQLVCNENNKLTKQNKITFVCLFARHLNKINPLNYPSFAFAWLQLICNHNLISYLLDNYQCWDLYAALLTNLLKFLNENVNQSKLYNQQYGQIYQKYYLAVLKLIIVLIHDYSSFLSAFSLQLCLLLDGRFIQLKNIINSAYPSKQLQIPLKFEKRDDLQSFVEKVGYPKYYKLNFDKARLDVYLLADFSDLNIRQKLIQQDDLFLQTLILYFAWLSEHKKSQYQSTQRLLDMLMNCKDQFRSKLLNLIINLIRYPNHITLFFIDFVSFVIFKQNKDKELKQNMLNNIVTRMRGQVPIAWGLIYLVNFVLGKKQLEAVGLTLVVQNT